MLRQRPKGPWVSVMDYVHNSKVLLEEPVADGVLQFEARAAA